MICCVIQKSNIFSSIIGTHYSNNFCPFLHTNDCLRFKVLKIYPSTCPIIQIWIVHYISDKNYQISLRCYPYTDESSSYINAVQVDGFRSPGRYIVSQQPLPNTVGDFWRMVWERQCTVIISLNEIDPKEKVSLVIR